MTKSKKYRSRVQYQKHSVVVVTDYPIRKGECCACHRKVGKELKVTQLHHYRYAYRWETVKKNPILALDYTLEFCYGCHPVGDCLRVLASIKDKYRILDVYNVLPVEQRKGLNRLVELIRDE